LIGLAVLCLLVVYRLLAVWLANNLGLLVFRLNCGLYRTFRSSVSTANAF
jgi:hypothetical protein